ncbi:SHOCT domain-containing protein [Leifsonia sp. Leaf264]|uniref:SHOCT domain-containing protein n=1 Tax=Leifsonia sp. Leaf264 TaxID=1736314 RepID=UPI0006F643AB|nr:hypothetical protein [Leifsonia sp. Leaf264]KQP01957.1 hypothetical protein ASF30_00585 [Leifsonia sp. Leaf264]
MLSSSITLASVSAHVGPWAGGWGWLFLLIPLFWISVIALIVTFSRRRWARYGYGPGYGYGPAAGPWNAAGAEQTLADRFARGDIDEVEYRARLEVLRASRSAG